MTITALDLKVYTMQVEVERTTKKQKQSKTCESFTPNFQYYLVSLTTKVRLPDGNSSLRPKNDDTCLERMVFVTKKNADIDLKLISFMILNT